MQLSGDHGRAEITALPGSERRGFVGGRVQNPQVCSPVGARGDRDNPVAIGRKGSLIVVRRVIGQALEACAVGMNAV